MKRLGLINTIFLPLLFGFGLLIVTADHRALASVDLLRPATLLSLVASRRHAVYSYVCDLVRAL